jgi:hypothetical protein
MSHPIEKLLIGVMVKVKNACFEASARRSLAGGLFVVVLAFALERGGGFPVAKRAGGEAELGGDRLLCHSLAEQLRRPLLLSGSLLAAAALVGELLLGPRPHRLAAPARRDAALPGGGGLGGGAGAGGGLERGALASPSARNRKNPTLGPHSPSDASPRAPDGFTYPTGCG